MAKQHVSGAKKAEAKMATKKGKLKRIGKGTLRWALTAALKEQSGRTDISFKAAPDSAAKAMLSTPVEQRAGYPLHRRKGSVDPSRWRTIEGKAIVVDFYRRPWLPDHWGQGVKWTNAISTSTGNDSGAGAYTLWVSPDGMVCYHKPAVENVEGRRLGDADGRNGQIRLAQLQAKQALELARQGAKNASRDMLGLDADKSFFKVLSASERKCLPHTDELYFAVISARRTGTAKGLQDIFVVQTQLVEAGVTPTWYVDEASLNEYRALGIDAVVGGKLTVARNMALRDARALGKACVQVSDDISAWEYREGRNATSSTDDAMNAAHEAAKHYIVTPVAAARFILAKMRSVPGRQKPQLGGVYMLGSCARTFATEAFGRHHFVLGDFFVVDDSKVRFDENMTLKEDYDFACAHIKAHGSVMRCNRMTLSVKHYSNAGGACTNRDRKGEEERRNIAILNRKWPGVFLVNPKRKNEVIMSWRFRCGKRVALPGNAGASLPAAAARKLARVAMFTCAKRKLQP